ncbi:hypothetical protein [Prescottella agglutinans]|uniref:Uncharacterized protein n=1 Tax=Prescottella agglutinans TaxID=1644129 RepID=A0ABT6M5E8_9NOCA|nr:hypothetical protein [Prescottella agglutinans]MDH6279518.1 hypothetical protein [Prescottella agglutinans]
MEDRVGPPKEVLEAFVLRARRILAHSLIRSHRELMTKVFSGEQQVIVTENHATGEVTHELHLEFPPDEAMESFAVRIRPLLVGAELIHYKKVLTAIEKAVPADKLEEFSEPISWWRTHWAELVQRRGIQAYSIVTASGPVTDREMFYAWLYGDLVHADDVAKKAPGIGVEERYRAAAGVVSRIGECVERTYELVRLLYDNGLIELDPDVFNRPVVVEDTKFVVKGTSYLIPDDAPLPKDIAEPDPSWQPVHEVIRPGDATTGHRDT